MSRSNNRYFTLDLPVATAKLPRAAKAMCAYCKKSGHTKYTCDEAPFCRFCGNKGHPENRCFQLRKAQKESDVVFSGGYCRDCGLEGMTCGGRFGCPRRRCLVRGCRGRGHSHRDCPLNKWCYWCRDQGHELKSCKAPVTFSKVEEEQRSRRGTGATTLIDFITPESFIPVE